MTTTIKVSDDICISDDFIINFKFDPNDFIAIDTLEEIVCQSDLDSDHFEYVKSNITPYNGEYRHCGEETFYKKGDVINFYLECIYGNQERAEFLIKAMQEVAYTGIVIDFPASLFGPDTHEIKCLDDMLWRYHHYNDTHEYEEIICLVSASRSLSY